MREFVLDVSQEIPRPIGEVFSFFADAGNLQQITPGFLHFEILTPLPIAMAEGTLIDYRIRLRGVPIRWRTRINVWEPGRRFVDEQLSGPYRKWVHTHTFEPTASGTSVRDHVVYAVPLGELANRLFVRRQLETIFEYRRREIGRLLGDEAARNGTRG